MKTELSYQEFLTQKRISVPSVGFSVEDSQINSMLFPFQKAIVMWALKRGRAALFEDCGLGKTPQQLEWAHQVSARINGRILILAPLAVAGQTKREGEKFGIPVHIATSADDVTDGINIANYEKLHKFKPDAFSGIVLDESSILKGFDGVYRKDLTDFASTIKYRLACTATPAPNDFIELLNHAEFLDIMTGKEIIALYFTQDGNTTHKWRIKGHAQHDFWKWMAQWSIAIRKPSDIGYEDGKFTLPPLNMRQHEVKQSEAQEGFLFPMEAVTLEERRGARNKTIEERTDECAALVNASDETWIVWCNLNSESDMLRRKIKNSVEVKGSDDNEHKETSLLDFGLDKIHCLISKPTIAGFGMNYQNCHNMAFVGLSDSYEQLYQAIRRCWRFGQERPVECHIITADTEGRVVANIKRKEKQAEEMFAKIVQNISIESEISMAHKITDSYEEDVATGNDWTLYLGDSIKVIEKIEDESIGLSVFSPPFPGMYTYSNSASDVGNVKSISEMIKHYRFLIPGLFRIIQPGRSCCVHLTQAVAFKGTDGYIGIKDFRGEIIKAHEECGFIYYGEVCIDKDPQVKAIRTKDAGLLFKSLARDSSRMHMALADYIIQFRKPGENKLAIKAGTSERYHNSGWISPDEWIEWAAPVWYRQTKHCPGGIRETDVLNVRQARESDDERHLCPLQLGVIERCVKLWSAPGDTVFSPFAGIGSEGYKALELNRKFIGIELKKSYWKSACDNLRHISENKNHDLFSLVA